MLSTVDPPSESACRAEHLGKQTLAGLRHHTNQLSADRLQAGLHIYQRHSGRRYWACPTAGASSALQRNRSSRRCAHPLPTRCILHLRIPGGRLSLEVGWPNRHVLLGCRHATRCTPCKHSHCTQMPCGGPRELPSYARLLPRDTRGLSQLRQQCSLMTVSHLLRYDCRTSCEPH